MFGGMPLFHVEIAASLHVLAGTQCLPTPMSGQNTALAILIFPSLFFLQLLIPETQVDCKELRRSSKLQTQPVVRSLTRSILNCYVTQ